MREEILSTNTLAILEDIYAPFKSKRKTRADIAREFGLDKLLDFLMNEAKSESEGLDEAEK